MQRKSYLVDRSVYIKVRQTLVRCTKTCPPLVLDYGPTKTQHLNAVAAITDASYRHYDLFSKIDDDDVYRADYVAGVVADFEEHRWDYSCAA